MIAVVLAVVNADYKAIYTYYEVAIDTQLAKVHNEQNINIEICNVATLDKVTRLQALTFWTYSLKKYITANPSGDWKTIYSYATIKECANCLGIDLEAILIGLGITP